MFKRFKGDGANHDPPEASSISSGLSIIGKIVGHGALTVFGHVEGELHASTVVIAEGAQMEGELVAEELTIGGRVKGTIHANRVKLTSTAVVEGDSFHQTLAIDENTTATAESKPRLTRKVDQDQSLDDASKSGLLPSDRDEESVNEAARGSVAPDAASAHAPLSARDEAQPTPASSPAQVHEPLNLPKVYGSLPPDCDSPTFAGLKSSTDTIANTETAAETVADTETIAETAANALAVFEHSAIEKQSQSEPASSGVRACGDDHALRQRALRTDLVRFTPPAGDLKWPLMERIITLCMLILFVASVIVLLINYEESIRDNVPSPSASLYSPASHYPRSDGASVEFTGAAPVNDRAAGGTESTLPANELLTTSQRPPQAPPAISRNESVLKTEATLASAVNEPMPPIPSASDTTLTTHAAPIPMPQSAAPPPSNPAELLDDDEIARFIRRGKDFLKDGDFPIARVLFKRAADAGSAEAARALGSTYDPAIIKQLGSVSIPPDIDSALKWYAIAADRGSAEAADQYANLLRPPQTTGTVAAVVSEEPTSKPAEAAHAQDRAPPASAPRTPPLQMSSTQAPTAPDDRASQPTKEQDAQADATLDSEPEDRSSQVPGVQVSTAPVAAMAEAAHAEPSIAPTSEPKLPPSSAASTDAPQPSSEVASRPAPELSATDGSQLSPLQEASTGKQLKTAAGDNEPSRTTGTVVAAVPDEPTSKLGEAARAQEGAPPASAPRSLPSQVPSAQAPVGPDELTSQSTKMPHDQADSLPQSSPPQTAKTQSSAAETSQTAKTQSSAAETAPLSIPQPPEVPASTQIMAGHDGPQLLPSKAATPKAPEALSTAPQRQAAMRRRRRTAFTTGRGSCNIPICSQFYHSFRESDCTYQPYDGGPRRVCER